MTEDKQLDPDLLKRFMGDLDFYGQACLMIRTKLAEMKPFRFNNAQRIVHRKLHQQFKETGRVRAIVLKARQEGVSTYTAARFFRRLHLMPNQEALVLADELDRARKLFTIYDRFAHHLPPEIQPMMRYVSKQTQMVFDNPDDKLRSQLPGLGSTITVETAKDTAAGRASTINMMHASEMAFWPNAADVWVSLAQAVPDQRSEVIIESTANGVGNFFHQMWLAAEKGESGYVPIFLPWWIHEEYTIPLTKGQREDVLGTLDEEERSWVDDGIEFEGERHRLTLEQIAWRRQTINDKLFGNVRAFRQEYPKDPEEAFLVSGNCFFDEDVLKRYHATARPYQRRGNLISKAGAVRFKDAERGWIRIWEPPSDGKTYVIAADTASGRQIGARTGSFDDPESEKGGRDFSSADVLALSLVDGQVVREQVAQLHGRLAPEVFAQQLAWLGVYYSTSGGHAVAGLRLPALIGVERNHTSGQTVLRCLQQTHRYPRLHYARRMNVRTGETQQERLGFITNAETRMPMLDELAMVLREEQIRIPNVDTIREMQTFIRDHTGKPQAQEGCHDDRVISLAIALQLARNVSLTPPKGRIPDYAVGSSPTGLFDY